MQTIDLSFIAAQCRAARGLLNLSQSRVAEAAHIAPATLSEFERGDRIPGHNNLQAIRVALEAVGIVFIGRTGVRLRSVSEENIPSGTPISPNLCRAARYLLNLSQQDLAEVAGVARSTVAEFERGARMPVADNVVAMRTALITGGAEFINPNGGGPGVRLRE